LKVFTFNGTKGGGMKQVMKRYIEQLVEDLEVSLDHAEQKLSLFFDNSCCFGYFPIGDDEEGGIKVSDLIGLEKFVFPKVDYLNDSEAKELTIIMFKVYRAYGLNTIFSGCIPDKIKYGQLRDYMSHVVYPELNQLVDIEMCDYLPIYCPFASLCPSVQTTGQCCAGNKKRA